MGDKVFLRKVRKHLLKEGRIKEMSQVNLNGYSISKLDNGKYKLGVTANNEDREVVLELDENDKDLGYHIMKIKHRIGEYPILNKESKYKVSTLELYAEDSYLKVSIPKNTGEIHEGDFKYYARNSPIFNIKIEEYSRASFNREDLVFKDDNDYMEFCKEGYRVIDKNSIKDQFNTRYKKRGKYNNNK